MERRLDRALSRVESIARQTAQKTAQRTGEIVYSRFDDPPEFKFGEYDYNPRSLVIANHSLVSRSKAFVNHIRNIAKPSFFDSFYPESVIDQYRNPRYTTAFWNYYNVVRNSVKVPIEIDGVKTDEVGETFDRWKGATTVSVLRDELDKESDQAGRVSIEIKSAIGRILMDASSDTIPASDIRALSYRIIETKDPEVRKLLLQAYINDQA